MKKSYFAIGAIAAAMCSCSSESIPSAGEGNVLPGTEELAPISLSMTGNNTSVEVGSRTRGTGNVGGDNGTKWQNEKLYILMTSSDTHCLADADIDPVNPETNSWGFTNLNGEGPWLREQFNGAIWARPNAVDPDGTPASGDEYWNLVYKHTENLGNNDWYRNQGVWRYYPINGASDFFAYHIDDAAVSTNNELFYKASNPGGTYLYPEQTLDEEYPLIVKDADKAEMTVDFKIDGTQDLLAGKAQRDVTYTDGFSAKSARHNVVPNISMKHLLSRLTFTIYRGDELAKNIQITGITIKDVRNQGRMIVAYKAENPTNASLIQWKRTGADAESPDDDTYDEGALDLNEEYYRNDFTLMQSPANIIGDGTDPAPLASNKNNLDPLEPFAVGDIPNWLQPTKTEENYSEEIGAPMFVAPGETQYEMVLDYKVLVRDTNGNGVFDEPTDPQNPTQTDDLIEKMQVKYTLKAPTSTLDNNVFAQGKSYNIKITVYGLQPITAKVELTPWGNGDDIWIGGDAAGDKPENLVP